MISEIRHHWIMNRRTSSRC